MRKSIVDVSIYNVHSVPDENGTSYIQLNQSQCSYVPNCTTYTGADFIVGEIGALTGTPPTPLTNGKVPKSAT